MIIHSTSPPTKKLKNEEKETEISMKYTDVEVVAEEEMLPEDETGQTVVIEKVEAEVELVAEEEMQPIEDEIIVTHKEDNKEQVEVDKCLEALSTMHECREEQFRMRYEMMRKLKEEKNNNIEALQKVLEDVKLENTTLNFIISTIDNPKVVSDIIEENNRLAKENNDLKNTLKLKDTKKGSKTTTSNSAHLEKESDYQQI